MNAVVVSSADRPAPPAPWGQAVPLVYRPADVDHRSMQSRGAAGAAALAVVQNNVSVSLVGVKLSSAPVPVSLISNTDTDHTASEPPPEAPTSAGVFFTKEQRGVLNARLKDSSVCTDVTAAELATELGCTAFAVHAWFKNRILQLTTEQSRIDAKKAPRIMQCDIADSESDSDEAEVVETVVAVVPMTEAVAVAVEKEAADDEAVKGMGTGVTDPSLSSSSQESRRRYVNSFFDSDADTPDDDTPDAAAHDADPPSAAVGGTATPSPSHKMPAPPDAPPDAAVSAPVPMEEKVPASCLPPRKRPWDEITSAEEAHASARGDAGGPSVAVSRPEKQAASTLFACGMRPSWLKSVRPTAQKSSQPSANDLKRAREADVARTGASAAHKPELPLMATAAPLRRHQGDMAKRMRLSAPVPAPPSALLEAVKKVWVSRDCVMRMMEQTKQHVAPQLGAASARSCVCVRVVDRSRRLSHVCSIHMAIFEVGAPILVLFSKAMEDAGLPFRWTHDDLSNRAPEAGDRLVLTDADRASLNHPACVRAREMQLRSALVPAAVIRAPAPAPRRPFALATPPPSPIPSPAMTATISAMQQGDPAPRDLPVWVYELSPDVPFCLDEMIANRSCLEARGVWPPKVWLHGTDRSKGKHITSLVPSLR